MAIGVMVPGVGMGLICLGMHVKADKEYIIVSTKLPFKECLKMARNQLVNQAEEKVRDI